MSFLTNERQSRLRVLLSNLAEGQREFEEIARLDAQIRIDYHGRFLIELVQNAVDPPAKAGMQGAHLLIVRTPDLLAVLNQGAPFDDAGLKSILSLGLSSKRPDEAIGNKGVGFKSVFEVAETAEIFGVGPDGGDLRAEPHLGVRLTSAPAATLPGLVAEAMALAVESDLSHRITERCGRDLGPVIEDALGRAPGWRFPTEPGADTWRARRRELGLEAADLRQFQTAVVLHLRPEEAGRVERALAEFTDAAIEVHLFLPRVERLEIRDQGRTTLLERHDRLVDGSPGVVVRHLRRRVGNGVRQERHFWVIGSVVTGPELEAAVTRLPGEGWAAVRQTEVNVALPVPDDHAPLKPDGRYFVGLPSKDPTGSPFRVDARFHATLSRTALDRQDNPYNRLLDQEAVRLAATLLRTIRDAPKGAGILLRSARSRRAVTLGLASTGPASGFGQAVRAALRGEPVILEAGGAAFLVPTAARTITDADSALVAILEAHVPAADLAAHDLRRVEPWIEHRALKLLHELGVPTLKPAGLIARRDGLSLIERLAARLPRSKVGEWRTLLGWVVGRTGASAVDQRVLPLVGSGLTTPGEHPFVPLLADAAAGEVSSREVPGDLLVGLPFLDGSVLGDDHELRRQLVEGQSPVARRPGARQIIASAVLPAIAGAVERGDDAAGLRLLALGVGLLWRVAAAEDVAGLPWRVPCEGGWLPAKDAYLGDAWDPAQPKPDAEPGLVEQVYGPEGRCLRAWWGPVGERCRFRAELTRLGVADQPRFFVLEPVSDVIGGDDQRAVVRPATAPKPVPAETWRAWLESLTRLPNVDWGPGTSWGVTGVTWIDGLDRPEVEQQLAGWALSQRPDRARLEPSGPPARQTAADVEQPWVHFLRQLSRPFVPSHPDCVLAGAMVMPGELCRDVPTHVPWLPRAANGLNGSLLASVGVRALREMPASWLVTQLTTFAGALSGDPRELATAHGLWKLLADRSRGEALPDLQATILPLWRDGAIVAVPGSDVSELLVMDDAYTAEVLGDELEGALVLEPQGEDWSALVSRLRASLPNAVIRRVTEVPSPYTVDPKLPTLSLVHVVAERVGILLSAPDAGARVLAIIALLIRAQTTGVKENEKIRSLEALTRAKVQLGAIPDTGPTAVWVRAQGTLLSQDLDGADLVKELWPIIGPRLRDELLSLGTAIGKGDRGLRDFLRHKRIKDEALLDACGRSGLTTALGTPDPGGPPPARSARPGATIVAPPAPTEAPLGRPPKPVRALPAVVELEYAWGEDVDADDVLDEDLEDDDEAPTDPMGRSEMFEHALLPSSLPPAWTGTSPARAPGSGRRERNGRGAGLGRTGSASTRPPRARGRSVQNELYKREIGHMGELFAFRALAALLPDFDASCWVSTSRERLGLAPGDDTLGYDFRYVDTTGELSGRPGADCLIDVKTNGQAMKPRFAMSQHEWQLAEACHRGSSQVFIILRVFDVVSEPKLGVRLVDPYRLVSEGSLAIGPRDGWWVDVRAGGGEPVGVGLVEHRAER